MSQHITVTDYDPLWQKKYEEESLLIKGILADNCIAIYHIGSTSVPGLAAKPIIDISRCFQAGAVLRRPFSTFPLRRPFDRRCEKTYNTIR